MGFAKDNARGTKGEKIVLELLSKAGINCGKNDGRASDIWLELDDKKYTCEIKYDYFAVLSGNVAIEYHNCKQDKPSGIYSTKCDFWIHIVNEKSIPQIHINTVKNLKKFLKKTKPHKSIEAGGDKNANLHLYKKDVILPFFKLITHDNAKKEIEALCSKSTLRS